MTLLTNVRNINIVFMLIWSLCSLKIVKSDGNEIANSISSAIVQVKGSDLTFYGTSSSDEGWGKPLPLEKAKEFYSLIYIKDLKSDNAFGCSSLKSNGSVQVPPSFVLLVDRGECSFAQKALVAYEIGAKAIIVTDTLQQYYERVQNPNASSVTRAIEYDCSNGEANIGKMVNVNSSEWKAQVNNQACTGNSRCSSQQCVPTGVNNQVCCVWDIPDFMGISSEDNVKDLGAISVIRLRMADGDKLKKLLAEKEQSITFYERDILGWDLAQLFLWVMAVMTVIISGYRGSRTERTKAFMKKRMNVSRVERQDRLITEQEQPEQEQPVMELTAYHAFGFIIIGSGVLLLLYYTNIIIGIIILFAIGAVSAFYHVYVSPIVYRFEILHRNVFSRKLPKWFQDLETITWADVIGLLFSAGIVIWWVIDRHASYSWVLQDLFGISVCIVFLETIRLPNLKFGTILLVLVFLYDIFMVFISPYIFEESVMIKAAKGGNQGNPTASEAFCLRYPTNTQYKCQREEIPILLRFPRILDWRGGQAMLGLGDIVLPGLLVVFCARFDYILRGTISMLNKHFMAPSNNPVNDGSLSKDVPRFGFFSIVSAGYALGLFFANLAVVLMRQGQPALLYLVPCTLGPVAIVAWKRGALGLLWKGNVTVAEESGQEQQPRVEGSDDTTVVDAEAAQPTPNADYNSRSAATPESIQRA